MLLTPFLALGITASKAEDIKTPPSPSSSTVEAAKEVEEVDAAAINSRIYDATVIGEPLAVGKDKSKVWEKIMNARIVYLGEAEQVPISDDKELEVEIVKNLKKRCVESEKCLSLAMEAFPSDLQQHLDDYLSKRIDGEKLKSSASHWPPEWWQEYKPLLNYCRESGVQIVACGVPLKALACLRMVVNEI